MKSIISIIMTLFIAVLLLVACKKDKPEDITPSLKFSPEVVAFIGETQGKYRIFKDSASGIEDSVLITLSRITSTLIPRIVYDWITVEEHYQDNYELAMQGQNFMEEGRGSVKDFTGLVISSDTMGIVIRKYMNTTPMLSLAHSSNPYQLQTIGANIFENVVKYTYNNGLEHNDPLFQEHTYWWAKGIGIIFRRITNINGTKTQYLVRYN